MAIPMREETAENGDRPLRTGWTTGATATAAAMAAAYQVLADRTLDRVHLSLPKNREADLDVHDCRLITPGVCAEAGLIKDAGDDPDATHGARVWVRLTLTEAPGVVFRAGAGVGTVTRAGLALAIGEPAISVLRRMIDEHLPAWRRNWPHGGFDVTVGVDDGEAIAQRTRTRASASSAGCRSSARRASCGRFLCRPSPPSTSPSTSPAPTAAPTSRPVPARPAKTRSRPTTVCRTWR